MAISWQKTRVHLSLNSYSYSISAKKLNSYSHSHSIFKIFRTRTWTRFNFEFCKNSQLTHTRKMLKFLGLVLGLKLGLRKILNSYSYSIKIWNLKKLATCTHSQNLIFFELVLVLALDLDCFVELVLKNLCECECKLEFTRVFCPKNGHFWHKIPFLPWKWPFFDKKGSLLP